MGPCGFRLQARIRKIEEAQQQAALAAASAAAEAGAEEEEIEAAAAEAAMQVPHVDAPLAVGDDSHGYQ